LTRAAREQLDAMLHDVGRHGPWVSTHPDVTLKNGRQTVKEVVAGWIARAA
jgi:hypothetical protein